MTGVTPFGPTWRDEVTGASALNFLVGIWLIGSPFALDYGVGSSTWLPVACGVVVAIVALVRVSRAQRRSWLSGVNALVGASLLVAGPLLSDGVVATCNSVLCGAAVVVLGLWSMLASAEGQARERERRRRATGRRRG